MKIDKAIKRAIANVASLKKKKEGIEARIERSFKSPISFVEYIGFFDGKEGLVGHRLKQIRREFSWEDNYHRLIFDFDHVSLFIHAEKGNVHTIDFSRNIYEEKIVDYELVVRNGMISTEKYSQDLKLYMESCSLETSQKKESHNLYKAEELKGVLWKLRAVSEEAEAEAGVIIAKKVSENDLIRFKIDSAYYFNFSVFTGQDMYGILIIGKEKAFVISGAWRWVTKIDKFSTRKYDSQSEAIPSLSGTINDINFVEKKDLVKINCDHQISLYFDWAVTFYELEFEDDGFNRFVTTVAGSVGDIQESEEEK